MRSSPDAAPFAARLAEELAQAGILVHLGLAPPAMDHTYVVALGSAANAEVPGAAGRVAIAPTDLKLDEKLPQPLLLMRPPGPAPVGESARPVWELRFAGLKDGVHLSVEEEHTIIEAVVLWIRNRAVD
jgi:hypothetical protein